MTKMGDKLGFDSKVCNINTSKMDDRQTVKHL